MLKGVAGQAIGSQVLNASTGAAFVGPVTVHVTGDGGVQTQGQVLGGLCTHEGNGYHSYQPSQAETNYNLIAFTFVGSGAIPATVQVATITEAQAAAMSSVTISLVIGDGPTRIELLNQLAHRLNKNPPPNMDSATETRLGSYLNQRQRRLLTMPGLKRLRDGTIAFTAIPDQADLGLPSLAKVSRIYETENDRVLYELSQQDLRLMGPTTTIGTPEAFVWRGRQVVAHQPAHPAALWVQSSSGSDNTAVLYVEGSLTGGVLRRTSVMLNGTTPTNIAPAVSSWERIDKCYLSAPVLGVVTLTEDSGGGVVLASIPAGQVTSVYTGLTFYPAPSSAIPYVADITRPVTDLINDTDQAAIPEDFADLLVLGALADEYQHLSDPRWSAAMTEYKERENQLKYWLAETHIGRPFGLSRSYQRPSQLGSWFPAGT